MLWSSIAIVSSLALYAYWFYERHFLRYKGEVRPPLVPYFIPFLGHLPRFLLWPQVFLDESKAKYGNLFTIHILGYDVNVACGPKNAAKYLNSRESDLSFLKGVDVVLGPFFPKGLFSRIRNTEFKLALSRPLFDKYVEIIVNETNAIAKSLGKQGKFNVFDLLSKITLRLNTACFGGPELNERFYEEFSTAFFGADPQTATIGLLVSKLKGENRVQQCFDTLENLIRRIITEREKDNVRYGDYIDNLKEMLPRRADGAQTNTYAVLSWTLIYIVSNRKIADECIAEYRRVFSQGEPFSIEKIDQLQYLEYCMLEAARLEISGSSFRRVMHDQAFGNYLLKRDELVCLYTSSVHRDSATFRKPDDFEPERFLPPREEQKKTKNSVVVFGGGPHECLGRRFVTLEIKLFIIIFLLKFEFELENLKNGEGIKRDPKQIFFTARPKNDVVINYSLKN